MSPHQYDLQTISFLRKQSFTFHRSDERFTECVEEAVNELKQHLTDAELKSVGATRDTSDAELVELMTPVVHNMMWAMLCWKVSRILDDMSVELDEYDWDLNHMVDLQERAEKS